MYIVQLLDLIFTLSHSEKKGCVYMLDIKLHRGETLKGTHSRSYTYYKCLYDGNELFIKSFVCGYIKHMTDIFDEEKK